MTGALNVAFGLALSPDDRKRQVSVRGEQRVRLLGYPDPIGRSLCEEKDHAVP